MASDTVAMSASVTPEQRDGWRVIAAQHRLSMSAAIAAIGTAAAEGDERLHAILTDHAAAHKREHGGARHAKADPAP